MRLLYLWSAIALPLSIEALSIARDSCSNVKCNAPGCDATNNFLPDGQGQCFDGACVGQPCLSVCPSEEISCNQFGCAALYGGNDTAWKCSSGDYTGCPCDTSCPTILPKCSDAACQGSSNSVDQYGICGSPPLSDCACINSCLSSPGPCSNSDCLGLNDPSGSNSVCTEGSQLGCSCESSCPASVQCDDPQCQGFNNPFNLTASFCTAGSHMGCRCSSVCELGDCTADGCNGINNLNGSEFCTTGNLNGCHCQSACPSTPPSCSDETACDGFEGTCTLGSAWGCACTGTSPVRKRGHTEMIIARDTTVKDAAYWRPTTANESDSDSDISIPFSYYVAAPRGQSSTNPNGNTRSYPRQQIQQAIRAGHTLSIEDLTLTGSNGRTYPQRFYVRGPNAANFNIPTNGHVNTNRLVEFPIIRNPLGQFVPFTEGGDPGPDRVVFDGATGGFAGVFTHRGEINNNFHRAPGHNADVNAPAIDNNFGPTILDVNPFGWFSGATGDPFPQKRAPTSAAATFPTTFSGCPSSGGLCYCYNTVTVQGWYPRDAAVQAINQACSGWSGQKVPVSSSSDDVQTLSTSKDITLDGATWTIEMAIWQTLLVGVSASTVDQKTCATALLSAMDDCQTGTIDKKIGGQYIVKIPNVGSQQYVIHPGQGNLAPPGMSGNDQPYDT